MGGGRGGEEEGGAGKEEGEGGRGRSEGCYRECGGKKTLKNRS